MSFKIDQPTSLLLDCLYIPSPNCNDRPDPTDISLIVVHGISLPAGQFGGPYIEQLFTNRLDVQQHESFRDLENLKVSSHLFIRRDGQLIQFVPFDKRAWHAGESRYEGRENCNDFSIGIELEGTDNQPYEDVQYQQLSTVIKALLKHYPALGHQHIIGHSDIAPGRKTDPGPAFDWAKLAHVLDARLG
ncbi:1,6-anhydro-N-acetylmuramyl-L-alanine amidase [hydrothermal vent metagenome]|uniref:1,6-anhydro-N-acetylmuramyl-L-alanine amidase AmpD n=1 Tax=hydrothermal vent metagenome TaxID=652676 RepID=A0A3B0ZQP0_9ZZZZ